MKLKHWQGYGSINATKKSRRVSGDKITLIIEIIGNHECGIIRNDKYDLYNWLVKRFDKTVTDYRQIEDVKIHERTVTYNGKETDCAVYEFIIRTT